jgi:hypothetical protein
VVPTAGVPHFRGAGWELQTVVVAAEALRVDVRDDIDLHLPGHSKMREIE